jgi:hypothetical protein
MTEFPTFLLQSGDIMSREKIACSFSDYPVNYCTFEGLANLKYECRLKYVPVGSVEFTREFCKRFSLEICEDISSYNQDLLLPFYHRALRPGLFSEASPGEFIKSRGRLKLFTGTKKADLKEDLDDDTPVWISDFVPFKSEFRFYIHDFVTGPKILGWSRYDDHPEVNPPPSVGLVERLAEDYHKTIGPNGYSIDIGWREDIGRYSLVEVNDGWSLGLYDNTDPQSSPPSRKDYAELLVSRWRQILFCNIV